MPSDGDQLQQRKLSRRSFVKSAGALVAAGAVGGAAASVLPGTPPPGQGRHSEGHEIFAQEARAQPGAMGAEIASTSAFSIFWMTDTQFLSESNPALLRMMTNWIVRNWSRFNAKLVVHTGDIVETGSAFTQWSSADDALSVLLANKIPYIWCAGNHDDLVLNEAVSGWIGNRSAASLDPSKVSRMVDSLGYVSWVGDHHDAMNTAVSFSASGVNYLVVAVEWNAQQDVLDWVESLLNDPRYVEHRVILAPHAYVDASGSLYNSEWASQLDGFTTSFTSLLDRHSSNVFLTLNGHFPTECGFNTSSIVNNRNELMFDRQDCGDSPDDGLGRGADSPPNLSSKKVGGSTITVLTFSPDINRLSVQTLDLFRNEWRKGSTERYVVKMYPSGPGLGTTSPA